MQANISSCIKGIDIDVMARLAINCCDRVYEHDFDHYSISRMILINGAKLPFARLKDWFVIYLLLPDREPKVLMIKNS